MNSKLQAPSVGMKNLNTDTALYPRLPASGWVLHRNMYAPGTQLPQLTCGEARGQSAHLVCRLPGLNSGPLSGRQAPLGRHRFACYFELHRVLKNQAPLPEGLRKMGTEPRALFTLFIQFFQLCKLLLPSPFYRRNDEG